MASKQYGRAQDMAVDAFDEAHTAIRGNPLTAVAIALGIGFIFGVVAQPPLDRQQSFSGSLRSQMLS